MLHFNNSLKSESRGALCCNWQAGSSGSTAAADRKTHPSEAHAGENQRWNFFFLLKGIQADFSEGLEEEHEM